MKMMKYAKVLVVGLCLFASMAAAAQADTLKIGMIFTLTGPGAPWGVAGVEAGKIRAAEINASGGLDVGGKKYQVEIIAYDDMYKAAAAIAAYNRLVNQDGVKFVIVQNSAPALALKDTVEGDKILTLTSAYAPKAIDENSQYMFRLLSIPTDYMQSFATRLKKNVVGTRMAMMNPNDETGWGQNQLTSKLYKDVGYEITNVELYERSTNDFQPLLTKILANKPDLLDMGASSPATATLIVRQARELGFKGRFVQTGGAGWATVVAADGKEAAEGMVNILFANPANVAYQHLAAEYKKAEGQDPNEYIAPIYDAVSVLLKAVQKAGDVNDATKVMTAIPTVLPMKSLQGEEITYGHHQFQITEYIGEVRDGKAVVLDTIK